MTKEKAIARLKENPLDRERWIEAGKAMGWEGGKIRMCVGCGVALRWNENPTMDGKHGGKNGCGSDIEEYEGQWLIEWHRFIDHLAEGGTAEEFFKEIGSNYKELK